MDWAEDTKSNLWCFPRGIIRNGSTDNKSLKWTSKYGSLGISFYEKGIVDGMNESGLVANTLYLAKSDYGEHCMTTRILYFILIQQLLQIHFGFECEI